MIETDLRKILLGILILDKMKIGIVSKSDLLDLERQAKEATTLMILNSSLWK